MAQLPGTPHFKFSVQQGPKQISQGEVSQSLPQPLFLSRDFRKWQRLDWSWALTDSPTQKTAT